MVRVYLQLMVRFALRPFKHNFGVGMVKFFKLAVRKCEAASRRLRSPHFDRRNRGYPQEAANAIGCYNSALCCCWESSLSAK
ncbi:hypothetical protein Sjap_015327 [Stephania japonica]|uniref:Uncharacterized protein n=1 Tax=Stephania japonica TaxID=461633 RepID=A0AAP0NSR9_9MAGN